MALSSSPQVSIVVPVYNGAAHLHECLASIAEQTYSQWEAIIVNNCSDDGTGEIADSFARSDPRFRVVHCKEFLPQVGNYNRALSSASPEAEFVKMVEADNYLWPECIERMVEVARMDDQIGLVGCYYLAGRKLQGTGLPPSTRVVSGIEVGRAHLVEQVYYLGNPTTLLFSAKALKTVKPCFRPSMFYDDVDLCLRLLQKWKFGFAHQVLAYIRHDNSGLMSEFWSFHYWELGRYLLMVDQGSAFFQAPELPQVCQAIKRKYYRCLGEAAVTGRGRKYWNFHRNALAAAGQHIQIRYLAWSVICASLNLILNPKTACERVIRRLRNTIKPRKAGVIYAFDR